MSAFVVVALAACSSDTSTTPGGGSSSTAGAQDVAVTLQEFAVSAVPTTVSAGSVTFTATNNGPDDQHEMVVIKTDLDPTALPTAENGSVDEEGAGIEAIDEIPEFDPNTTQTLTVDLEAGAYVLICNIYDEAEHESHYQKGMRLAFTVS
jgi:uncharacterized cupredoxin-like copper-binding protein